jgi:hypothetical protein
MLKFNGTLIDEFVKILNTLTTSSVIGFAVGTYRPTQITQFEKWSLVAAAMMSMMCIYLLLRNKA